MNHFPKDGTNSFIEPWPFEGIEHYKSIQDGEWGYLYYSDETKFIFSKEVRPSDEEILKRWGKYLKNS